MSWFKLYMLYLMIGLSAALLSLAPGAELVDGSSGLSLLFRLRGTVMPPSEIVLVTMGMESATALNSLVEPGRWSRLLDAEAVRRLKRAGAELIVFDRFFGDSRPGEDEAFANAMDEAGNVILVDQLKLRRLAGFHVEFKESPTPLLARAALASAPFLVVQGSESDTFLLDYGADSEPTLPVRVLQVYLARTASRELISLLHAVSPDQEEVQEAESASFPWTQLLAGLETNPQLLADSNLSIRLRQGLRSLIELKRGRNTRYFSHYGPVGTIKRLPYHALVLEDRGLQGLDLRGKIVVVGFSEDYPILDGGCAFFSPYSKVSMLELLGTVLANLLENREVQPLLEARMQPFWLIGFGLLLGLVAHGRSLSHGLFRILIAGAAYLVLATSVFRGLETWLPIVLPIFWEIPLSLLACLISHYRMLGKRYRLAKAIHEGMFKKRL